MNIIINVKESATLGRINDFDIELRHLLEKYDDVVGSMCKEW